MTDTKSAAPSCGSMKPLSREAEHVLRNHGTERPGSSALNREKRAGAYFCAGCGTEVFSSATKYDSGSGWPSFYAPVGENVAAKVDTSHGMHRVEVHCAKSAGPSRPCLRGRPGADRSALLHQRRGARFQATGLTGGAGSWAAEALLLKQAVSGA